MAAVLQPISSADAVVLGLPRGGVVVGFEVASALHAPLDVCLARKLGAPCNEELGIGAIASDGICLIDDALVTRLKIAVTDIAQSIVKQNEEMERRSRLYRGGRTSLALCGRTVILVDDGLATGITARAAVRSIRLQSPGRVILAAPVSSREAATLLVGEVDAFVCLSVATNFRSVGNYYTTFEQTTDEEVLHLLSKASQKQE